eukprot:jgi/Botrbrau1/21218/Bobra.39_2s0019.1
MECPTASAVYADMLGNREVGSKCEEFMEKIKDQDQYVEMRYWARDQLGVCTEECRQGCTPECRGCQQHSVKCTSKCVHRPEVRHAQLKVAVQEVAEASSRISQSQNIPMGILKKDFGSIFSNRVLVCPTLLQGDINRRQCGNWTMQDIVIGSSGSSTLFHIDSVPIASTILVIAGRKDIIGWPISSQSAMQRALGNRSIPTYFSTQGCIDKQHWEHLRTAALGVEGGWAITLEAGQHAEIPPLHIHGVYNTQACVSLNTTSLRVPAVSSSPRHYSTWQNYSASCAHPSTSTSYNAPLDWDWAGKRSTGRPRKIAFEKGRGSQLSNAGSRAAGQGR